ncbi:uncharacterized protein BX664DRAFT_195834 [Halteromyces radiatus]|uniref:uncharacterized protein n=1 Tax=Halteromyces radiatus TaxID=101107 RepID=UPI002220D0C6|nr:uncharacterized protein BX664DRAFT_195834 [Halteromyces radiatus]KAI8081536.1 hypothetical protein BX664DRAFT_195834 [Halteromyces radiatus]
MTRSTSSSPVTSSISFQDDLVVESSQENSTVFKANPLPTLSTGYNNISHNRRVMKSNTYCSLLAQNRPQGDIELATEIGHGLLVEVQKLQGLLQEKNDSLTSLTLEKADCYQEIDQLRNQLKQRSDQLGKFPSPL